MGLPCSLLGPRIVIWNLISLWSGRFSLITGTALKFSIHACKRGNLSSSISFTPTASSMVLSHPAIHPKAMSANPISSPPKNFFSPRPCSSMILSSSLASFTALSCSSPTDWKKEKNVGLLCSSNLVQNRATALS
ncbi:unnamed protein product, partial [Vitis vinifera]